MSAAVRVRSAAIGRLPQLAAWSVPVAIAGIGFVLRLLVLLRGGGLTGIGAYDDGVYYAAAASLVHGRLPYLSFLFIQPPGIVLAAAPFAALGAVAGDPTGFAVGRVAFELVGGLNAALVFLVLRRYGRIAPVVGGGVRGSRAGRLRRTLDPAGADRVARDPGLPPAAPTGGFGPGRAPRRRRGRMGDGCEDLVRRPGGGDRAAGDATTRPVRGRRRHRARGRLRSIPPGCSRQVVREVVLDPLGRPRTPALQVRLAGMVGARAIAGVDLRTVTIVLVIAALTAAALAVTVPGAAVFPVLLLADAAVLLASPSWFEHYGDLTAAPLALCAALGVQRALALAPARPVRLAAAVTVAAAVLVGGFAIDHPMRSGAAVPARLSAAVARTSGCVTSDDPTVLASTDVLSRDLADPRCEVWPDVTGWTYDAAAARSASGVVVPRADNSRWQRMVLSYLESGRATIAVRQDTGLSRATRSELDEGRPLSTDGHFVLRSADRDDPAGART